MQSASQWEGVIYLIPAILEVLDLYRNSSQNGYYNGSYVENGIFVDCDMTPYNIDHYEYYFMGLMSIFIMIFAFMTHRVSFKKYVCYGRPGLPLPMNMLNSHEYTTEYTLAFLSLSEDIFYFIFGLKSELGSLLPIVKFFLKLIILICFSAVTYPLFAAIYGRHLVGYVLAIMFLLFYITYEILVNYCIGRCLLGNKIIPLIVIVIVFLLIDLSLIVIFIRRAIIHIRDNGWKIREIKKLNNNYKFENDCQYVNDLLNKKERNDKGRKFSALELVKKGMSEKRFPNEFKLRFKESIHQNVFSSKVPPRLIIGICVGLYYTYRIFMDRILDFTPTVWNLINGLNERFPTTETNIKDAFLTVYGNYSQFNPNQIRNAYRYLLFFYTQLGINCILCSVGIGLLNSIIQSVLILKSYRQNLNKLCQKGNVLTFELKKIPEPNNLILGFVQFSGYQAAYILWGILVLTIFLSIFLYSLIGLFILPLIYVETSWARYITINYGPVLIATIILNIIQSLIVKYFFVKEKGKLMEVDNRRAFMIFTHCIFFLNAVMGIFNSIKRVFIWIFSGVFCFSRIDFSALPNYLIHFDTGFMCYVGFMFTEHYHHNSIVKSFVHILNVYDENTKYQPWKLTKPEKKYKNKWHVAYTLIKNIQLQHQRKCNLNPAR